MEPPQTQIRDKVDMSQSQEPLWPRKLKKKESCDFFSLLFSWKSCKAFRCRLAPLSARVSRPIGLSHKDSIHLHWITPRAWGQVSRQHRKLWARRWRGGSGLRRYRGQRWKLYLQETVREARGKQKFGNMIMLYNKHKNSIFLLFSFSTWENTAYVGVYCRRNLSKIVTRVSRGQIKGKKIKSKKINLKKCPLCQPVKERNSPRWTARGCLSRSGHMQSGRQLRGLLF